MFKTVTILPERGHYYKGNLHSHTVNSDGKLTPEESVALFRSQGYSFLCFSDHDRYSDYRDAFDSDDFIILPGLEASANLMDPDVPGARLKVHHLHGILGNSAMQAAASTRFRHLEYLPVPVYEGEWDGLAVAQGVANTLRNHGCLVTYNHPIWSRVEAEDFCDLNGIWALEIYNYNTVNESNTGFDTTYWDKILRSGRQIFAFASDDNHNEGLFDDACGGWIVVKADTLDHDAIIDAMLVGNYYSSSGPAIYNWGIKDGNTVWVDCSPCERVNFICGGYINAGGTVIAASRDGMKHVEFTLKGTETYVRLECVDYAGKTAWSNAHFLERDDAQ